MRSRIDELLTHNNSECINKIFICHNGSLKEEFLVAQELENELPLVRAFHTDRPGVGAGCKLGINACETEYFLITGSDLPFGTSDLDRWCELVIRQEQPEITLGSKLHPKSVVTGRTFLRRLTTSGLAFLKRLILGPGQPMDSQGTIFMKTSLAKEVLSECFSNDFFFTTELVTRGLKAGGQFVEIPVVYLAKEDGSSVSPFRSSFNFLTALIRLKFSLSRSKR